MNEVRLQFWLSTASWWLLSQAGLFAAAELVGPLVAPRWTVILVVLLALAFLTTRFVEIERWLRQAALMLFGGMAGSLLALWAPAHWERIGWLALLISLIGTAVALLMSSRLPDWLRAGGRWLVVCSWLYVPGWIFIWFLTPPALMVRAWAGLGAIVFWGFIAVWASSLSKIGQLPDVARAASQLTLLSLNLILSMLYLLGS